MNILERAKSWHADTIEWQETARDGTRYTLLEGRRDEAGSLFSYAFFVPGHFWDPPHWHSQDARIFVLRGTLWLGYGDQKREEDLRAYPVGSFILVPAGVAHWDGAYENTLIIGVANGPWSTTYVDPTQRPSAGTV